MISKRRRSRMEPMNRTDVNVAVVAFMVAMVVLASLAFFGYPKWLP